jgi:hypothetical protein
VNLTVLSFYYRFTTFLQDIIQPLRLSPIQSLHEHAVIAIRLLETKEPKINVSSELVLIHEPPKSNPMGVRGERRAGVILFEGHSD